MTVGGHISFDEDASPNGAEGFKAWLEGMIFFHLPNMSAVVTIEPAQTLLGPRLTLDQRQAKQIWERNRNRSSGKIFAIKELRHLTNMGLKEAKDYIDAAERGDYG